MTGLQLSTPNRKLNHGYSSAAQAPQLKELSSKIQASPEVWLSNATIDMNENTNPYFLGSIINDNTVKSLEFCELIKTDKYCTVWKQISADELGQLAQVVTRGVHQGNANFSLV